MPKKNKHWHPMVVASDRLWKDYSVTAMLHLEETKGRVGIAVRQANDRCYDFVGIDQGEAVLLRVQHELALRVPREQKLDSKPIAIKNEENIVIKATVEGNRLEAEVEAIRLESIDDTLAEG